MQEKSKVPVLRFKEFVDDWEQRKLGQVCQITMGQSPDGATYSDTPSDYILVQGNADLKDGWVSPRIWTTQKTKTATAGDLIMSVRAPAGAMGKTSYDVVLGRGVAGIKGNEFLFQTLVKMDGEGYWKTLSAGSTFESINSDVVAHAAISLPHNVDEQSLIGVVFKNLDNLIALQQRKYFQLCNFKKSMLEKMFPRDGVNVPDIRFEGFSRAWKLRKLGELTDISSAARVHKEEWTTSGVPFFRSSDVVAVYKKTENEKAFISKELYEKLSAVSGRLEKEDILITGGGSIAIPYIVPNNEPIYSKDADLIWIKHSHKFDSRFLYVYIETPEFREYIGEISHIGTIAHYTIEQVKETPIKLPTIAEQVQIGSFFFSLDSLITLRQRKLERLKNIKKAFLEKMFV